MPTLKTILVTCWFSSECFGLLSKHFDLSSALWLNPVSPDSPFDISVITSIFIKFSADFIFVLFMISLWDMKYCEMSFCAMRFWRGPEQRRAKEKQHSMTDHMRAKTPLYLNSCLDNSLNLVHHCPGDLARSVLVTTFGIEQKTDGNRNIELIRFWCSLGSLQPLAVWTPVYVRPE